MNIRPCRRTLPRSPQFAPPEPGDGTIQVYDAITRMWVPTSLSDLFPTLEDVGIPVYTDLLEAVYCDIGGSLEQVIVL